MYEQRALTVEGESFVLQGLRLTRLQVDRVANKDVHGFRDRSTLPVMLPWDSILYQYWQGRKGRS